ncbi:serine/threonine-protein kinase [Longispora sp. NPDC051575]|uniref:serine/threonine-protein kinase n=1 Tax=Longispora sp. NPDC051575 TaxID=3154943 RepID=UPI0034154FA3
MTETWTVQGYTEVRELGRGGAGRVVLATHDVSGVRVAIKYLAPELCSQRDFLLGFRGEARLLAELRAPNVVRLFEYVETDHSAAIVMELVDGIALRALLKEHGATGPEAALYVLKGSLLGLAAAHAAGVVHRDYKPENVLIDAEGNSKLADFGISARTGTTGQAAGTPSYMAPEQWKGKPASPRTDIYAATATFFECVVGRKPYVADIQAAMQLQHEQAPIPADEAPEPVRELIRRGMAKDPLERPADAAAFVAELDQIATAGYGPGWEEKGRNKLAERAALLALLFPLAGPEANSSAVGTTVLGKTIVGGPKRAWFAAGAIVLLIVVGGGATGYALSAGETTTLPLGSGETVVSASPSAPGDPSPSPDPSASATPSPSATPGATPGVTVPPTVGPNPPTLTGNPNKPPTTKPPTKTAPPTTLPPQTSTPSISAVAWDCAKASVTIRGTMTASDARPITVTYTVQVLNGRQWSTTGSTTTSHSGKTSYTLSVPGLNFKWPNAQTNVRLLVSTSTGASAGPFTKDCTIIIG